MGVTIHYRGRLNHSEDIPTITAELEDICQSAEWTYRIYDDSNQELRKLPFRGIVFKPHPDCEDVWMLFRDDGCFFSPFAGEQALYKDEVSWAFTKTQFAGMDVHIALCRLFKYLANKWFSSFEVNDEGGYWESENSTVLKERIGIVNDAISAIK